MSEIRVLDAAPERLARLFAVAQEVTAAPPARPAKKPPQIDGYRLTRELGRGGQAIVFHAIQQSTGREVALKVLRSAALADSGAIARLKREVQSLAALRHHHIVSVIDSGKTRDGCAFLVTDYVPGVPLDEFVRTKIALPSGEGLPQLVRLFGKIVSAVNAAHERGIIHRDLKPSNILVDDAGDPYVLDFGIARAGAPRGEAITLTGYFVGSLPYASPEQADGIAENIDHRSDIYALGVILYELVAGKHPYDVTGPLPEALAKIKTAIPLPIQNRSLNAVISKALAKQREQRYGSASDFAKDLESLAAGPSAPPISASRRPLLVSCGVAALVGIAILGFAFIKHNAHSSTASKSPAQASPAQQLHDIKPLTAASLFLPAKVSIGDSWPDAVLGDFNGDKNIDIAMAGRPLGIIVGAGDGTFLNVSTVNVPNSKGALFLGTADFNGDHLDDLVGLVIEGKRVVLLTQNASGLGARALATKSEVSLVTTLDLNHDERPDLLVYENTQQTLRALINDGAGNFAPATVAAAGPAGVGVFCSGDFNGDGMLDVAVTAWGGSFPSWFAGLREEPYLRYGGTIPGKPEAYAAADLNRDGLCDLVTATFGERTFSVLIAERGADGHFSFKVTQTLDMPTPPKGEGLNAKPLVLADVTGDSAVDLIVAEQRSQAIAVFPGRSDGSFEKPILLDTKFDDKGVGVATLHVADMNHDGKPDIVATGAGSSVLINAH